MRQLPGGVAILSTRDPLAAQAPVGIAVSSVISVTMDPPSMLVAVNRTTSIHGPLGRAGRFCLNLLGVDHQELVKVFSSGERRDERFRDPAWQERHGLDFLDGATCIFCRTASTHVCGTHELFIGEVFDVVVAPAAQPVAWMQGALQVLAPLAREPHTEDVWIPGWDTYPPA